MLHNFLIVDMPQFLTLEVLLSLDSLHLVSLVSVGHPCILHGLFSENDNLSTVNHKELQLMSSWHHDVVMSHRNWCLCLDAVTSHGDGCFANMKKDVTDTSNLWLIVYLYFVVKSEHHRVIYYLNYVCNLMTLLLWNQNCQISLFQIE